MFDIAKHPLSLKCYLSSFDAKNMGWKLSFLLSDHLKYRLKLVKRQQRKFFNVLPESYLDQTKHPAIFVSA